MGRLGHAVRKHQNARLLPHRSKIKVMTVKASKGRELPVMTLPCVGHVPVPGEDEKEAAREFYVAATGAPQRLVMAVESAPRAEGALNRRLFRKFKHAPHT